MNADRKRSVPSTKSRDAIFELTKKSGFRHLCLLLTLIVFSTLIVPARAVAQGRGYTIWGDVNIKVNKDDTNVPMSLTIILYDQAGKAVGRQTVPSRGRYRFNNLVAGDYEVAIESETGELTRVRLSISGPDGNDFRQDFEFEWKPDLSPSKAAAGIISAADVYNRTPANKSLFQKAQDAATKKKYDQSITFLKQILENDKQDFQVWTLLGTVYLVQDKTTEAEKAYLSAIEAKPTFGLALLNLGKLRAAQRKFEEAIDPLTRAVAAQPQSGEANLLLGESYLQLKKGSKAVGYLNEAARLGRPEAHLRLGWLYNAAGLKEKAAAEYEEFIKKKPDYPDRKKLEEYISANRKS